ncbi:DNA mismatch repair protein MutT [Candidatus Epulonipiscium fishelsonii]|uniref:DNA mismatch repair protein MutT n=1 Tax=Candidatus Epulonipiscium fishelsonii TaxID=77094 RepID=A0ACC8XBF6_9FIRM|nr:DNA mismatch repair protein MutT [Epulopiscium sp. SCG-B05WGA-EpuloA1]ONI39789.1 DNA mismatch repair protein MutT [Epulopiscium sp. SCG-B11WGA-EpuloA1]
MQIKKLSVLAKTRYLTLYDAIYTNKKGTEKHWSIASRKNKETLENQYFNNVEDAVDAVVIVGLHRPTKSLVIIKQFRLPVNSYIYELPAGLIDPNETIENTLKRELKEETGLNITEIINDGSHNKLYLSPGMTDESVALVYCLCDGELSQEFLEEDEDITPMLVNKEKAIEILNGNIRLDIKCFLILSTFAQGKLDDKF